MTRRLLLAGLLACCFSPGNSGVAQTTNPARQADSLETVVRKAESDSARARGLAALARFYAQADTVAAAGYLSEAVRLVENDVALRCDLLNTLGDVHYEAGGDSLAIRLYQQSAANRLASGRRDLAVAAGFQLAHVAVIHRERGRQEDALRELYRALKISDQYEAYDLKAYVLNNIGGVHQYNEELDQALDAYNKSLQLAREIGKPHAVAGALNNIGMIYYIKGDYAEALRYFEQTIKSFKASEDLRERQAKIDLGTFYQNKARCYFHLGERKASLDALGIAGNYFSAARARRNLAYLYLDRARYWPVNTPAEFAYVLARLDSAERIAARYELHDIMHNIYELKRKRYAQTGDYRAAVGAAEQLLAIKRQLQERDNKKRQKQWAGKIELYQRKTENDLLQQEEKRLYYANLALFVLILGAAGLGVVVWFYRGKVKKSNNELTKINMALLRQKLQIVEQKDRLTEQHAQLQEAYENLQELDDFKEVMTNMIVHDLKNPLSAMISVADQIEPPSLRRQFAQSVWRLRRLTLDYLDLNKLEQQHDRMETAQCKLGDMCRRAEEALAMMAADDVARFEMQIDETIIIEAEKDYFIRMLTNLTQALLERQNQRQRLRLEVRRAAPETAELTFSTGANPEIRAFLARLRKTNPAALVDVLSEGGEKLALHFCLMTLRAHGGELDVGPEQLTGFRVALRVPALPAYASTAKRDQRPRLTEEERADLAPLLRRLRALEVYDVSEIEEELEKIPDCGSAAVEAWREEMRSAVFSCNAQSYRELVSL